MISSAGLPSAIARSRSSARPLPSPSTMRRCSRSLTGSFSQLGGPLGLGVGGGHAVEQLQELLQRVVRRLVVGGRAPPVVDHVQRDLALLVRDPGHRDDLGRVHDRRVEAGLDALVEEDRVEHDPGGRVETEGDVGQPQGGLHVGEPPLDLADRLDGLDPVAAGLLLTGGDREGQRVDDDVAGLHAPVDGQVGDQPLGDRDLPVRRTRLALLVDGQRDDRGTVLDDQLHDLGEPRVGTVAVLVVDRVDHRPAAQASPARPAAPPARWSPARSAAWRRWPAGRPSRACRPARRGRRSRCSGRAGGRRRGSGPGRCRRSRPSAPPAAPRGTPWSRWRWSARRSTGSWCPAGTAPRRTARRPRHVGPAYAAAGARSSSRSTTWRRCSGPVPQHPPTSPRPNSPTNCSSASASSTGFSG